MIIGQDEKKAVPFLMWKRYQAQNKEKET